MEQTLVLAQFMGVFAIISAVSMLVRRRMVIQVLDDIFHKRSFTYFIGVLEVIGGLLLVLNHNIWGEGSLPTVVTILGWLILIEGVLYMFLSRKALNGLSKWLHTTDFYYVFVVLYFALGAILTYSGFGISVV